MHRNQSSGISALQGLYGGNPQIHQTARGSGEKKIKVSLRKIYQRLYRYFGPQGWWPAESKFEVIIGAILTQNTNWQNVYRAIKNLKKEKLLSCRRLKKISFLHLAYAIRPAGYYRLKAKRIRNFLDFFSKRYGASLKKLAQRKTPLLRKELLGINGIGPETADSILLYALDKPIFVVDAYTKRILSRHHLLRQEASYAEAQELFMRNLRPATKLFNEYHALLVKLAKDFCHKNKPRCAVCPLKNF